MDINISVLALSFFPVFLLTDITSPIWRGAGRMTDISEECA